MALAPTILRGSARTVTGTCESTVTLIEVHYQRVLVVSGTSSVRYQVYSRDQGSIPATGDAAPSAYVGLLAGDSVTVEHPQPGILPWFLAVWGSAGGETATVQVVS